LFFELKEVDYEKKNDQSANRALNVFVDDGHATHAVTV